MQQFAHHYIDGAWLAPSGPGLRDMVDPTTEEVWAQVATGGGQRDVDLAVAAARRAFADFSRWTVAERIDLIDRIIAAYRAARSGPFDPDRAGSRRARQLQGSGHGASRAHAVARDVIATYAFERQLADTVDPARTHRRLRVDLALELADPDLGHQGDLWDCRGMHDGPEAVGRLAGQWHRAGRGDGRGGRSVRGVQPGPRARARSWAKPCRATPGRHGFLHRVHHSRHPVGEAAAGDRQAHLSGTRRQVGQHRPARCRSGKGRPLEHPARVFELRASPATRPAGCWSIKIKVDQVLNHLATRSAECVWAIPRDPTTTHGPLVHHASSTASSDISSIGMDEGGRLATGGPGRVEGFEPRFLLQAHGPVRRHPRHDLGPRRNLRPGSRRHALPRPRTRRSTSPMTRSSGLAAMSSPKTATKGYISPAAFAPGGSASTAPTRIPTPMGGYKQSGIGRSMGVFGLEEYLEVKSIYGFEGRVQMLAKLSD
jgi:aldehyde dehydrogenase (NAD+)